MPNLSDLYTGDIPWLAKVTNGEKPHRGEPGRVFHC